MKEIKAIIQPIMADQVIDGLREITQLPGFTVSTVTGFGGSPAASPSGQVEEAPMTRIELVVQESLAERVIETIARIAHTGRSGDGKIFVTQVADVIRISSGERGEPAL